MLVRFAGRFTGGKRVNSLVDVAVDTMPTLLQACEVDIPEGVQGISYLTLLEDGENSTRDHVQYQRMAYKLMSGPDERKANPNSLRGIRTKDWLYVRNCEGPIFLFDQNADRDEMTNLAEDPAHAEIQAALDARVLRNMEETGDAWELGTAFSPPDFPTREFQKAHLENVKRLAIEVP